jgi:hypothetical protein
MPDTKIFGQHNNAIKTFPFLIKHILWIWICICIMYNKPVHSIGITSNRITRSCFLWLGFLQFLRGNSLAPLFYCSCPIWMGHSLPFSNLTLANKVYQVHLVRRALGVHTCNTFHRQPTHLLTSPQWGC